MQRKAKIRCRKLSKNLKNASNNKASRQINNAGPISETSVLAGTAQPSASQSRKRRQHSAQVNYLLMDQMAEMRKKCGCFRQWSQSVLNNNADAGSNDTYTQRYLVDSSGTSLVSINTLSDALEAVPKPITTTIPLDNIEKVTQLPAQQLSCNNKKKCTCAKDDFLLDPTATCKCRLSIASLPVKQNHCFPDDNYSLISTLPIPEELAEPLERNRRTQTSEVFQMERINHERCQENPNCIENCCPSRAPSMDCLNREEDDLSVKGSTDYILFWEHTKPNTMPKQIFPYRRVRKVKRKRKVIVPLPRFRTECQMLHDLKYPVVEKPIKPKKEPPPLADILRSWCPLAFKLPPRPRKVRKKIIKKVIDPVCRKDALIHLRNLNNPNTKKISCQHGCLPTVECVTPSESNRTPSAPVPDTSTAGHSNLSIFNFDMDGFI